MWDEEIPIGQRRPQTRTHEGSGVTSRSLTVTVDGSFSPPPLLPLPSFPPRRLYVVEGPPRFPPPSLHFVRLLLPFRNFDALGRASPTFLFLLSFSSAAKVDRLRLVNQVAS